MATEARTLGDNLAWVRGALDEHLSQVRNQIQLHVQNSEEVDSLRPALLQMQQLHGVLGMIQCYGPLMLVEEMSHALEHLIKGDAPKRDIALEALLGGTLQLADYLDLLRSGEQDGALVFHPVINELRMAIGLPVLSERALFVAYFHSADTPLQSESLEDRPGIVPANARELSSEYEDALLGWLRSENRSSVSRLTGIASQVEQGTRNAQVEVCWDAMQTVLEALRDEQLQPSLDLKRLFGQMGQCLARLGEHDEMDPAIDLGDLPTSLLYYVKRCEPKSDKAQRLSDRYGLEAILPEEATLTRLRDALRGPNTELLSHLSVALKEDMANVKDRLDLMERSSHIDEEDAEELLETSQRIADTLHMLGMTEFRQVMRQQILRFKEILESGTQSEGEWMNIATALLQLEQGLDEALFRQLVTHEEQPVEGSEEESLEEPLNVDLQDGVKALLQEVAVNIARLQEFVRSFLNDGEAVVLTEAGRLLDEIRDGLNIIGYTKASEIAGRMREFLGSDAQELRQDRTMADYLADAVAAFEFYLQAQKTGRAQAPILLEQVTSAMDKLQRERGDHHAQEQAEEIEQAPERAPEVEAEPVPAAEPEQEAAPEAEVDPEIREIFLEEAQDVLSDLNTRLPRWVKDPVVDENLGAIRRAFHTFKGSGRMVNATEIGELSWSVENLLNRCLEGALPLTDQIISTVQEAVEMMPRLLESFGESGVSTGTATDLMNQAHKLAEVKAPEEPGQEADAAGQSDTAAAVTEEEPESVSGDEPGATEEAAGPEQQEEVAKKTETSDVGQEAAAATEQDKAEVDPELLRVFFADADKRIESLDGYLHNTGENQPKLFDVMRSMHVLRGSAETAGLPALAQLAEAIEDIFESIRNLRTTIYGVLREDLEKASNTLYEALQRARYQPDKPAIETGEIVVALQEHHANLAQNSLRKQVASDAMVAFTDEGIGFLERIERALNTWFDAPEQTDQLEIATDALAILADTARDVSAGAILDAVEALEEWVTWVHSVGAAPWREAQEGIWYVIDGMYVLLDRYRSGETGFSSGDLRTRLSELSLPEEEAKSAVPDIGAPEKSETVEKTEEGEPQPEEASGAAYAQAEDAHRENELDIDPEMLSIFLEEATELLEGVNQELQGWRAGSADALGRLRRALHTLKGSARMTGAVALGDLSHEMESLVDGVQGQDEADQSRMEQVQTGVERMHAMVDGLVRGGAPQQPETAEPEEPESPAAVSEPDPATGEQTEPENVVDSPAGEGVVDDEEVVEEAGAPTASHEVPAAEEPAAEEEELDEEFLETETEETDAAEVSDAPAGEDDGEQDSKEDVALEGWEPALFATETGSGKQEASSFGDNARVSVAKLRSMLDDAGEINIYRSRMEQQTATLQNQLNEMQRTIERSREQLHNLEIETEASILARHRGDASEPEEDRYAGDFDPLEMDRYTRIQELSRFLSESMTDLESLHGLMNQASNECDALLLHQGRVNTTLQEGLMGTMLVPFSQQTARLKRLVSQTCDEAGKHAQVLFQNENLELDRTVLERMTAPMEHILRNAVIHGLETTEEREEADKRIRGTIRVALRREAAQLVIDIADDGKGLDLHAIRKRAEERDLVVPGQRLNNDELASFILEPGFSTAQSLTKDAGRGVGMDVANTSIRQLGGALTVHTETGEGTRFSIRLPVSLALSQTLLARVGEDYYAFPLSGIEGITRVASDSLVGFFNGTPTGVNYGGQEYSLRYLGDFVGVGRPDADDLPDYVPVLAINMEERCVGLVPDELLTSQEVVVKSVGPIVSTVPGISGATVMADGNVVLILDPEELLLSDTKEVVLHQTAAKTPAREDAASKAPLVMVVDDSITIRRVTEKLLVRHGMRVGTARDGMDAWSTLQSETPDLMLLDIEMPHMDGFELATHMRNSERLKDVPIIMITSRSGDKHREHASKVGVNRFLTKPYQEGALLSEIKSILPEAIQGDEE